MFDSDQLTAIDAEYFNVITVDEYDVTLQSRNTGHYWYLHCTGVSGEAASLTWMLIPP